MNRGVLIVSANGDIGVPLWHAFERAGVRAEILPTSQSAMQLVDDRLREETGRTWSVIIDAVGARDQGASLIRRMREAFPEVFILAALETPDVATTQAVTKAGAWDYLVHPFDEEQIAACLRLWGEVPSASPGRLVCFLPARGGDGASTVALHVAESAVHERSARGFAGRVLLVDLDFQAGDMAFRLRLAPQRTLGDALLTPDSAPSRWKDCVCPWGQVDVLASPPPGAILANDPLSRTDPQGGAVADTRLAALLSSAKARYPLVVCDLPPAMHSSARAVLRLADEVCVVCTPEITSLHFARRRVEELQQAGVGVENVRLILNRTGSHAWIGVEEVAQVVGAPVSALLANDYGGLQTAILAGGVVARRSTLGRQIGELTRQTLGVRARVAAA